jgi:hypothetical protein
MQLLITATKRTSDSDTISFGIASIRRTYDLRR